MDISRLGSAPRKPGGFAGQRRGRIALTEAGMLALSAPRVREEVALSEVEGYGREPLTVGRQWLTKLLELLIVGAAVGLIVALVVLFMPRGDGGLSFVDAVINTLALFGGSLAVVFLGGLLVSIPVLLGIRSLDLFSLQLGSDRRWEFGVLPQQSGQVAATLEAWGIAEGIG